MPAYHCTGSLQTGVVTVARWAPRPPAAMWLRGETRDGRTVEIVGDPYTDERATITVDGREAALYRVERLRDGGTTILRTARGEIVFPSRLGGDRRYPTLDGEELYRL